MTTLLVSTSLIVALGTFSVIYIRNSVHRSMIFRHDIGEGNGQLTGQFMGGPSTAILPNPLGRIHLTIITDDGGIVLNHASYNADGGTWSLPPLSGPSCYKLAKEGNYTFTIDIRENFGVRDRLELINGHFRRPVQFSYNIRTCTDRHTLIG